MKKILLTLALVTTTLSASAQEVKQRIVEDGGTGPYKAVMKEEPTLAAHTVFVPQDLSAFSKKKQLPVLVWVMVPAPIPLGSTTSS